MSAALKSSLLASLDMLDEEAAPDPFDENEVGFQAMNAVASLHSALSDIERVMQLEGGQGMLLSDASSLIEADRRLFAIRFSLGLIVRAA